jgi:hypothetical protein
METKTKAFDAVEESRQWRESTSRKLDAMSLEQRLAHLKAVSEHFQKEIRRRRQTAGSVSVRSDI